MGLAQVFAVSFGNKRGAAAQVAASAPLEGAALFR
jgi:hypothetical protein